jgi:hypothetical protein
MASDQASSDAIHSVLDSSFPVLLPEDEALFMSEADFQALVKRLVQASANDQPDMNELSDELNTTKSADTTTLTASESVSGPGLKQPASTEADNDRAQKAPFIAALETHGAHHRTLMIWPQITKRLPTTSTSTVYRPKAQWSISSTI